MLELNVRTLPETEGVPGTRLLERLADGMVGVFHELAAVGVRRAGVWEYSESMSVSDTAPRSEKSRWNCADRSIPPSWLLRRLPSMALASVHSSYTVRG
jgi:hypothetical protein